MLVCKASVMFNTTHEPIMIHFLDWNSQVYFLLNEYIHLRVIFIKGQ